MLAVLVSSCQGFLGFAGDACIHWVSEYPALFWADLELRLRVTRCVCSGKSKSAGKGPAVGVSLQE